MSHHHHKADKSPNEWDPVEDVSTPDVPENVPTEVPAAEPPADTAEKSAPEVEKGSEAAAKLTAAQAEIADLQQKLLYLQADYQNYRKRVSRDIAEARVTGVANTLSPFLTVYDFLGMAGNAAEKSDNLESIRQGLKMIIGEFNKAFDELGVKKVATVGAKFDPEMHEAVSHQPDEKIPEGEILKEWAGGFRLGDRLLRPARVVVSAGTPKPGEAPAEKQ